ncbi:hypothetical protein GCM10010207_43780 [Streptomyces atratus]|nr:hypothetical protein GCM10010207_43780 [Streptomyces atratus]
MRKYNAPPRPRRLERGGQAIQAFGLSSHGDDMLLSDTRNGSIIPSKHLPQTAAPAVLLDQGRRLIGYGHPKDRRVDLKQAQAGLAVSADGGIPVHARVFGGGAAEVTAGSAPPAG